MDELETIGFIPNGGRTYCALSFTILKYYFLIQLILNRFGPVSTTLVHPGNVFIKLS